jgi:hypothetical protein
MLSLLAVGRAAVVWSREIVTGAAPAREAVGSLCRVHPFVHLSCPTLRQAGWVVGTADISAHAYGTGRYAVDNPERPRKVATLVRITLRLRALDGYHVL